MEENKYVFDDKELEEEKEIEPKELEVLVDEKTQREIENEIDKILDEISTQI